MYQRLLRLSRSPLPTMVAAFVAMLCFGNFALAGEADLAIPDLWVHGSFNLFGTTISAGKLLMYGSAVICFTLGISLYLRMQIAVCPPTSRCSTSPRSFSRPARLTSFSRASSC